VTHVRSKIYFSHHDARFSFFETAFDGSDDPFASGTERDPMVSGQIFVSEVQRTDYTEATTISEEAIGWNNAGI